MLGDAHALPVSATLESSWRGDAAALRLPTGSLGAPGAAGGLSQNSAECQLKARERLLYNYNRSRAMNNNPSLMNGETYCSPKILW